MDERIENFVAPRNATVAVPGSKSISNRALILAALSTGRCLLRNVLFADDTRVMLDGLQRLGFELQIDEPAKTVAVTGGGGAIPAEGASLFCNNSGTTIRFLSALCAAGRGTFTLDGIARMRQRPIRELVDILTQLGATVGYESVDGFPPVKVIANGLSGGGIQYGSAASSQFLSAVLMVSPTAKEEVEVWLTGPQTSWPYVWMTLRMMDQFGVTGELSRNPITELPTMIAVPTGSYHLPEYSIEPDASNAAYFWAVAAVHPGASVTVEGLGTHSIQGDVGVVNVLKSMGADVKITNDAVTVTGTNQLRGVDVDLSDMPDQAQTIAAVALLATGPTTLRGLTTLRVKETDRVAALVNELQKFGASIQVSGNTELHIIPPKKPLAAEIDTYDDHRMAMSFAIAATRVPGTVIRNGECVSKTYPEFFDDLRRVGTMKRQNRHR